ncbi:MAG TPA: serine protease [Polyangia bacterium]|jgi:hypothetical protein
MATVRMVGWVMGLCVLGSLVGWAGGCSDDDGSALPSFHDLPSAPSPIQTAAGAVVRISTAGQSGTGAFISPTGLLLTNNHVLGDTVCPIEGCTVQLTFDFQRGKTSQPPLNLLAVPVAVDVGLDMAVLQINIATPSFLTLVEHDAASLLGQHITIVGHPEGHLKKWTSGIVVDAFGDWFSSTAYVLPGDSGSPVLDDQGNLVGLIHRSPTGEDLITNDGVNVTSIGSASAPLQAAMAVGTLPTAMISTAAATTADAVVKSNLVYLNGHATRVNVGGVPTDILSLLGTTCDAALARNDFASPDDLGTALQPCNDGLTWIECRVDETPASYGTVCPPDPAAWTARFKTMNDLWVAMNGNTNLTPVGFGAAALSPSKLAGVAAGSAGVQAALAAAGNPLVDFGLENYLAAFGVASYAGTDTLAWLRAYRQRPGYQDFGTSIASAYLWWYDNHAVGGTEALSALQALAHDPNISVGAKLYVDQELYESGK